MSPWLALALVIILVGAFAILSRLHLLAIAITFWIAFAIGIAVIAAAGHQMTARWHLGPITGFEFWRVVVLSPEVMIFLFFMITDPKTTPKSGIGRRVYARRGRPPRGAADRAAGDGVLDEGRAARCALDRLRGAAGRRRAGAAPAACLRAAGPLPARCARRSPARPCSPACSCSPASPRVPRRPSPGRPLRPSTLPQLTVLPSKGVATQIDPTLAQQIAGDLVADLRIEADALRTRDKAARRQGRGRDAAPGALGADRRRRDERDHRPAASRRQAPARARDRRRPGAADRRRDGHRHGAARHLPRHAGGGRVHGQRRRRSPERSSSSSTGRATSSSARAAARPRRSHPTRRRSSSPPASAERASRTSPRPSGSTSSRTRSGRRRRWT